MSNSQPIFRGVCLSLIWLSTVVPATGDVLIQGACALHAILRTFACLVALASVGMFDRLNVAADRLDLALAQPAHAQSSVPVSTKRILAANPNEQASALNKPDWLQGKIYGFPFVVKHAYYGNGFLRLCSEFSAVPEAVNGPLSNAFTGVQISLPLEELEGKTFVVRQSDDKTHRRQLKFYFIEMDNAVDVRLFQNAACIDPYDMTLQFYALRNGLLPGRLDLDCIGGGRVTKIHGFFYARPQRANAAKTN